MKLQNMLLSSPQSTTSHLPFEIGHNVKSTKNNILTNLPPIQNFNVHENFKMLSSDNPEFLEPTPLIEKYLFRTSLAESAPVTVQNLPNLAMSSASSCSSDLSAPPSPTTAISPFELDPSLAVKNSVQTYKADTQKSCRFAYFPRIEPKPSSKMREDASSNLTCPMERDNSAAVSNLTLSPTMVAASTAAFTASNQNYSRPVKATEILDVTDRNSEETGKKFPVTDAFKNISKYKHGNRIEKRRVNQVSHISVADRLMFLTKNAHIKRPRNAWIHFRCHYGQALKANDSTLRAEEISKRASHRWSLMSESEKKPWHELAEQDKQAHKEAFPNYKYCPRRSNSAAIIARQNTALLNDPKKPKLPESLYGKLNMESDTRFNVKIDNLAKSRLKNE